MSELTDEQLARMATLTHSMDVPPRFIRVVASELFQYRQQYKYILDVNIELVAKVKELEDELDVIAQGGDRR